MEITIRLNDDDLEHFRRVMEQSRKENEKLSASQVCAHAAAMLETVRGSRSPDFVTQRTRRLVGLIAMVQDPAWTLTGEETGRVLDALSYFAEPHDNIPDSVPVFGFLDDAVMIELVLRELHHELDAYEEFCRYRDTETEGDKIATNRTEWLDQRRDELMDRMRRRRARDGAYAGSRPYSLFRTN